MLVKTVIVNADYPSEFDKRINAELADGWRLVKREVLPGVRLSNDTYNNRMLYAELVKMDDEPAEPEPMPLDPLAAARTIQAYCSTVTGEDCQGDRCSMAAFCDQIKRGKRPDEWKLPEEE